MKKLIVFFAVFFLISTWSDACEVKDYLQIRLTLNKYDKALTRQNTDEIKSFFDDNYKNADGFTLSELLQMLEKTYSSYSKMKQKTKIGAITLIDNYAIVHLTDKTKAVVYSDDNKTKEKQGILSGKSAYVLYLKKDDEKWKIFYDEILAEITSLKYGIANKIPMELDTPILINNGEEYNLALKMDKPHDIVALASIANEQIEYPVENHKEKFRKFPAAGSLERIVKANNNNRSEYAIASVGFTKISVNEEETKARIEMVGMAYLMKRINMTVIKAKNEEQSIK